MTQPRLQCAPYFTALYNTAMKIKPPAGIGLEHEWQILWQQLEVFERELLANQRATELLIQQATALLKQV